MPIELRRRQSAFIWVSEIDNDEPVWHSLMMLTREHVETREELEASLGRLQKDAESGYFDDVLADHLNYLVSQLPEGYMLDDVGRVVRLDPDLPDHFYITSQVNGVPSGAQVRVPVYTGEPVLSSPPAR